MYNKQLKKRFGWLNLYFSKIFFKTELNEIYKHSGIGLFSLLRCAFGLFLLAESGYNIQVALHSKIYASMIALSVS